MKLSFSQELILELLSKDYNQKQVAEKLKCSVSYVGKQISSAKDLYNVKNTPCLLLKYFEFNINN